MGYKNKHKFKSWNVVSEPNKISALARNPPQIFIVLKRCELHREARRVLFKPQDMSSSQHYTIWYGGYDLFLIEISQMIVDTAFQSSFSSLPKKWYWGALSNIQQLFCLSVTIHGSTRSNNHLRTKMNQFCYPWRICSMWMPKPQMYCRV